MKKQNRSGFTIIELLVVIVVIGILSAIVIFTYNGASGKAASVALKSDLDRAVNQLAVDKFNTGSYPTTETLANGGAGLPKGENTIFDYSFLDNQYCIEASSTISGVPTYRVSSYDGIIEEGLCGTPEIHSPSVTNIGTTSATLGANVEYDWGNQLTSYGICWGTSPNPTTNCTNFMGLLDLIGTKTTGWVSPIGIIVSPDDGYVYATNYNSRKISMYSRNINTGELTELVPSSFSPAGIGQYFITISPDGKSMYSSNANSTNVTMMGRDQNTGLLLNLTPSTITSEAAGWGIVVSNDDKSVYSVNYATNEVRMFGRDINTGLLNNLTPSFVTTSSGSRGIAISPDDKTVYVTNNNAIYMFGRDLVTGVLSPLSPASIACTRPYNIVVSPDGLSVYAGTDLSNHKILMFSRDPDTGLLATLSPASITSNDPYGIIVSDDGHSVYATNSTNNTVSMYSRDPNNGLLTALNPATVPAGDTPYGGISISHDGKYVYVTNQVAGTISIYRRYFGIGSFEKEIIGLPSGTAVYYRGFATNSAGTNYSEDGTFTTN